MPQRNRAEHRLLEQLERIEIRHEPESCTCGHCQRELVKIGEDISEQLDIEPARFFVIRHIRPQYACRLSETVHAAPVAPAVIDGGLAAPVLPAWVAIRKYLDHLPLYRVEQIAARQQVPLARSTLAKYLSIKASSATKNSNANAVSPPSSRAPLHSVSNLIQRRLPHENRQLQFCFLRAFACFAHGAELVAPLVLDDPGDSDATALRINSWSHCPPVDLQSFVSRPVLNDLN